MHGLGVPPAAVDDLVVLGAVAAPAQLLEEGDVPVVARLEREGHALGVAERRWVEVLSPKQRLAIPYMTCMTRIKLQRKMNTGS